MNPVVSPTFGASLTWGYADPQRQAEILARAWGGEARLLANHALDARRAAASRNASELTRTRLRRVAEALEHNITTIGELLEPIITSLEPSGERPRGTHDEIALPRRPHLTADLAYLFRDWASDRADVQAALRPTMRAMQERSAIGEVLVLGGGAMRLPWELANAFSDVRVTSVEYNPVLCCAAARLILGRTLDLYEVPLEPRTHQVVATHHSLRAPAPAIAAAATPALILGDVRKWTPRSSVDWLVTPFVLDVAGEDALKLIERWTGWLRPQGYWIHHGPLSFRSPWSAGAYTIDEIVDALPALGLEIEHIEMWHASHLASPAMARVATFHGTTLVARKATHSRDHS